MARYSRLLWPAMPTLVEAPVTWLARNRWTGSTSMPRPPRMRQSFGDASSWVTSQASAARSAGLGFLVEMNVLNGGTSASGIRGTIGGKYAMSASQLRNWGSTIVGTKPGLRPGAGAIR